MHAGQSFITNPQTSKPMQPGDGPLHDPAGLTQTAAVLGSTPRDLRIDAPSQQGDPMGVGVIGSIGLDELWFALGRAALARDGRNGIHQGQQLRHVMTIGLGQKDRERNALRVGKEVMLRAGTTAIGWVRPHFF